ncbi:HK97 gp10 family phage protein [Actinomadura rudentiformis]|uniref:HK97 gp10 family phage protein n=1 Tax=Actinomadura rudentiformis TaxID=359158 RepID=A0A6H9YLG9_9ACTN|nr:HK97 gp10 family phage protein [Actinomadura rudentiformis]KAB2347349.1 HK97 gp10 family phage protein [Actinomadura rudentiformis]
MIRFDADEIALLAQDLEDAADNAPERVRTVIEKTRHDVVRDAQAACPVDTGNLKSTIDSDPDPDGLGFEAGPTAEYGAHVEFGTVPHVITPRDKKALHWPGAAHPVARVDHPGTTPQPYLLPAFNRRVGVATRAFGRIVSQPWPRDRSG